MKFRYLIVALLLCLATGCVQEEIGTLSEIQLSQSYVSLNVSGGQESLSFTATDSWQIVGSSVPDWLTISPMSGSAGDAMITFKAGETKSTNTAEIQIVCGGKTQYVNVIQYAAKTDPVVINVKQAVDLIKSGEQGGGEYYVKGIVCKINEIDTGSYGNATYFLSDDGTYGDGNWLEVYRGYWLNGAKFTSGDEFAVGDELTIVAVLIDYNGTPETNQYTASVVSINKSLIKVDEVPEESLPIEGGTFDVKLTCKGDGITVNIPEEAQSWLSVVGISTSGSTATVTFNAASNAGGDRTTGLTFVTSSEGKTYSAATSIAQSGSILEVSIADFNAAEVGETQYRVTGVVSSIAKADYGNIYIRDWSGETYIYGIGAKGDFAKTGIKVGDIITVVGKRGAYGTTIEMLNTVVENVISVTEVDFPAFLAAEKSKDVYYRVTGTITSIAKADYGNLYIQDEAGNEIYVYGVYPGYGATGDNRKNFLATAGIEVGDKLTVEGYKDVYNGTVELCGGIYISHEKAQPDQPEEELSDGSAVFTVDALPAAYGEESVVKYGDMSFSINQVANYGNGIQLKKEVSYIANKTACKKIKKITLVAFEGKTWYPGNLKVYAGSEAKPETEISAVGEDCLVYDLSDNDCSYFKIANTSGYAVYLDSITIEY
ncbi:MAG: BACON domain-containing carbohydrate-binding protein [Bacteroidia bacterium]|nr:BACON domain-containing carbohydrate-binding protein [Bacteroidia bacterium]